MCVIFVHWKCSQRRKKERVPDNKITVLCCAEWRVKIIRIIFKLKSNDASIDFVTSSWVINGCCAAFLLNQCRTANSEWYFVQRNWLCSCFDVVYTQIKKAKIPIGVMYVYLQKNTQTQQHNWVGVLFTPSNCSLCCHVHTVMSISNDWIICESIQNGDALLPHYRQPTFFRNESRCWE